MTIYTHDPRLADSFDWSYVYRNCNDPQRKVGSLLILSTHEEFPGTNHIVWNERMVNNEWFWKLNRPIARKLVTHAEEHSILSAIDAGVTNFNGSILITTLEPCLSCRALIEACNISEVYYAEKYIESCLS